MSFDTLFGLRERVAPNLDRAVATVSNGDERFLWEISFPLIQQVQMGPGGPQPVYQMREWLVLTCPSPILGEGTIVSAIQVDLRKFENDEQAALDTIRQLAGNLRKAASEKLTAENPPPLPPFQLR